VSAVEQQQLVRNSTRAFGQARSQADAAEAVLVDSNASHLQCHLLLVQAKVVGDEDFLTTLLNRHLKYKIAIVNTKINKNHDFAHTWRR